MDLSEKTFLTVSESADYLRITKGTLYQWIHFKKIPSRKHGRKRVFLKDELEAWSQSNGSEIYEVKPTRFEEALLRVRSLKTKSTTLRSKSLEGK